MSETIACLQQCCQNHENEKNYIQSTVEITKSCITFRRILILILFLTIDVRI